MPERSEASADLRFPSNEKPQFRKGCIVNVAFQCFGLLIMLGMTAFLRWQNKQRDEKEGGRPAKGSHLETFDKFDLAPGESSFPLIPDPRVPHRWRVQWRRANLAGFRYVP
jgi:hypothetical protein